MTLVAWMLGLLIIAGFAYAIWRARGQYLERQRAAEKRMAALVAQAKPPATPAAPTQPSAPAQPSAPERLLFEAAAKAAQAGEPVLAIQLFARLLSRFPQSTLGAQARGAVAEEKRKLAKT